MEKWGGDVNEIRTSDLATWWKFCVYKAKGCMRSAIIEQGEKHHLKYEQNASLASI